MRGNITCVAWCGRGRVHLSVVSQWIGQRRPRTGERTPKRLRADQKAGVGVSGRAVSRQRRCGGGCCNPPDGSRVNRQNLGTHACHSPHSAAALFRTQSRQAQRGRNRAENMKTDAGDGRGDYSAFPAPARRVASSRSSAAAARRCSALARCALSSSRSSEGGESGRKERMEEGKDQRSRPAELDCWL